MSAEKQRQIGILEAIGWETGDVRQMKFWEGIIVSLSSFWLGVILAYTRILYASVTLFTPGLRGWATLWPNFRLTLFISGCQIAILLGFAVVP